MKADMESEQMVLLSSPIGTVEVHLHGRCITAVRPSMCNIMPDESEGYDTLRDALWACQGVPTGYTLELPRVVWAPHFWDTLASIPRGEVCTYGHFARMLGCPNHARAVGQVLHRNPIPILMPCHRIVAAGGALGGFGLGEERKITLLEHERRLRNSR